MDYQSGLGRLTAIVLLSLALAGVIAFTAVMAQDMIAWAP